jgi:hypothetical protein
MWHYNRSDLQDMLWEIFLACIWTLQNKGHHYSSSEILNKPLPSDTACLRSFSSGALYDFYAIQQKKM